MTDLDPLLRATSFPDLARWSLTKADQLGIGDDVLTKVTWNSEDTPSYGVWVDLANNRVYILRAGKYVINHHMGVEGDGVDLSTSDTFIYKNNSELTKVFLNYSSGQAASSCGIIYKDDFVVGDYIEIYQQLNLAGGDGEFHADAVANISETSRFSGYLVGE